MHVKFLLHTYIKGTKNPPFTAGFMISSHRNLLNSIGYVQPHGFVAVVVD